MATTFRRIQILIQKANSESNWNSKDILSEHIREEKIKEFQTKKGNSRHIDNYMKETTIARLIDFSVELGFLDKDRNGELSVSSKGKKALQNDDSYKRQMKSSVKSLLIAKNAPLQEIIRTSKSIKPPEFPDASTIYKNLPGNISISEKDLRRVLFLYTLAEGIERKTKVMYISS